MGISSRRNAVDVERTLSIGDIVQVKDLEWYDSLPYYDGEGKDYYNKPEKWPAKGRRCNVTFMEEMKKFLGKKMKVLDVIEESDGPIYSMSCVDGSFSDQELEGYSFINEMLVEC